MRFLSDEEYENYWVELGGVREAIASDLERGDLLLLDVACGWGLFTFHLASRHPQSRVVAVDIVPSAFSNLRGRRTENHAPEVTDPLMADATKLPIKDGVFDLSTSFGHARHPHDPRPERRGGRKRGDAQNTEKGAGSLWR